MFVSSFGLLKQPNTQFQTHKPASMGAAMGGVCLVLGVGGVIAKAMLQPNAKPAAALYPTPDHPLVAMAVTRHMRQTRPTTQWLVLDGRNGRGQTRFSGCGGAGSKATGGNQRAYTDSIGILDEGVNRLDGMNSYRGFANDTLNGSDVNIVNNRIDQSRSRERCTGRLHKRRT